MRSISFTASILVLSTATAARSQSASSGAVVDSATVARAAWSSAVRALRANDVETAQREVERASVAWPSQGAYHWYRALLAARRYDTAAVRGALLDYARLGLGRDLSDSTFDRFREMPWFSELAAQHEENRKPLVKSRARAVLSDSTWWPEGVDYDPVSRNLYVTSVRHRTVMEVTPGGRERELWPRAQATFGAIFGIRVDPRDDAVLWVTTSGIPQMSGFVPQDTTIAALLKVRRRDGAILRRWDLNGMPALLGDLAIGPAGDAYLTDSRNPILYVLRPGADTLEAIRHPLFRSLQGLAPTPDGSAVYVADYSHGLLRVDVLTRRVTRLADAPGSTTLGCDGIAWHGNGIIAIQNGVAPARVMLFTLDSSGTRIIAADVLDRNPGLADEPTIGAIAGDEFVYVANSQWEKYNSDGTRRAGTALTRPVLLAVPLRP